MAYIIYVLPAKILKMFESRLVQFGSSFIQTCFLLKKMCFSTKRLVFLAFSIHKSYCTNNGDIVVQLKIYSRTT